MTLSRLPSKCKQCKCKFTPEERARGLVLHADCISAWIAVNLPKLEKKRVQLAKKRAAEGRRVLKARKEKLKGRRDWLAECQAVVNKYVRQRDHGKGCISCGALPQAKFGGSMDAGHWRSVGSAPHLRYYLPQIAAQCVRCNRYLGGSAVEFRKGLIQRLGVERVEQIEAMQGTAKWPVSYLERLKRVMSKRVRRLEKRNAEAT